MLSIDEQTHLRLELTAWDEAEVERSEAAMVLSAAEREAWQALLDHVVAMGATLPERGLGLTCPRSPSSSPPWSRPYLWRPSQRPSASQP